VLEASCRYLVSRMGSTDRQGCGEHAAQRSNERIAGQRDALVVAAEQDRAAIDQRREAGRTDRNHDPRPDHRSR
jgi:hypothetical protein